MSCDSCVLPGVLDYAGSCWAMWLWDSGDQGGTYVLLAVFKVMQHWRLQSGPNKVCWVLVYNGSVT